MHIWMPAQLMEAREGLLRAIADMENMQKRTARQADSARQFALQARDHLLVNVIVIVIVINI